MKVVDNFLDSTELAYVKKSILGHEMVWSYSDTKVLDEDVDLRATQFYHLFCQFYYPSKMIDYIKPIGKKIDMTAISRIKANLEVYQGDERYYSKFHYDYVNPKTGKPRKEMKVGIFYLNTNNGYTEFEDGTIVRSIENRFVEFTGDTLHRGVSSTDVKKRIVINFNYF